MKKTSLLAALLLAAGLMTATSCKKKEDDKPTCRIIGVTENESGVNTAVAVTYDTDKRISQVQRTTGNAVNTTVFTYSGNTISATTKNRLNIVVNKSDITLNNEGLISTIQRLNPINNSVQSTTSFEYSNRQLTKVTEQSGSSNADVTTTTYSNGNLATTTSTTGMTQSYEYYTDRNFLEGDFLRYSQYLESGALAIVNRNLVKAITTDGSDILNLSYNFDNDGKVTHITQTQNADVTNYDFQYQCD
jgi:hypothetical protein